MQKITLLFQTASKAGSHGLLTYASTSCYGGIKTKTTPCPKVSKHDNDLSDKGKKGRNLNVTGILPQLQS